MTGAEELLREQDSLYIRRGIIQPMSSTKLHRPSISLDGQVAVVTGGGRGIGRAVAQTLSAAGAKVAVIARSQDELEETVRLVRQEGGTAQAFPADVTVS